jgi:hypothetical protein
MVWGGARRLREAFGGDSRVNPWSGATDDREESMTEEADFRLWVSSWSVVRFACRRAPWVNADSGTRMSRGETEAGRDSDGV